PGAGAGTLRSDEEPQSCSQGTRHAPAPVEMAVGAARATFDNEAQTRGTPHEARCRPRQGTRGLAFDRCRCSCERRHIQLCARSQQAATSPKAKGRYLLRTNLCGQEPAELWQFYIQLTEIEAAFRTLK